MRKTDNKGKDRNIISAVIPAVIWTGVWWAAVSYANRTLLLPVPDPPAVLKALLETASDPSFWKALLTSALRVTGGFAAAFAAGSLMAVLAVYMPLFRSFFAPVIRVMRTLPVACFIFVIYLWMSTGMIPGFISFIMALPSVYENIYEGAVSLGRNLTEMAAVFGMDAKGRFVNIVIPSLRPFIAACAVSGLGMSWKAGIASEIICRPAGSIGNILWSMKTSVDYPGVFAVSLLILLAGIVTEDMLRKTLGENK